MILEVVEMTDSLLANILAIVYIILSIAIIALVLLQKGKTAGMGAISGGSGNYFDTNANRTKSAILSKITVVVAVLIIVLTIVLNIVG